MLEGIVGQRKGGRAEAYGSQQATAPQLLLFDQTAAARPGQRNKGRSQEKDWHQTRRDIGIEVDGEEEARQSEVGEAPRLHRSPGPEHGQGGNERDRNCAEGKAAEAHVPEGDGSERLSNECDAPVEQHPEEAVGGRDRGNSECRSREAKRQRRRAKQGKREGLQVNEKRLAPLVARKEDRSNPLQD